MKRAFTPLFIGIVTCATLLRMWQLSSFPRGMHTDEAWWGYNAWMLAHQGSNIYEEKWPLTVDMFGDHVPAVQAYLTVPALLLFGATIFSIRLVVVIFSLLTLLATGYLVWILTKNKALVLASILLFALSPWNIIMARGSSTVIIDTFWVVSFCISFTLFLRSLWRENSSLGSKLSWGVLAYGLSIVAYFTYFTSRLVIFPVGLLLFIFLVADQDRKVSLATWVKKKWRELVFAILPLCAFLIFPFGIMLNTPYALGRFEQTTVFNSDEVKGAIFNDISRSGQAGLPPLVTRAFYNKVTENVTLAWKKYVALLSPSVLLFQSSPPARYHVPNVGVVTLLEYVGLIVAVGFWLTGSPVDSRVRRFAGWSILATLVAAIPSGLTLDDHPNLQRAVMMTPFLQMAAATGWYSLFLQVNGRLLKKHDSQFEVIFPGLLAVLSVPWVVLFLLGYFVHAPFDTPYYRNRAGEKISHWINENAATTPLLIDHWEGVYFYPYFLAEQNILDQPIVKSSKYFTDNFKIGERTFVKDLCRKPEIVTEEYEYVLLYTHFQCPIPWWMTEVHQATYDDGSPGFTVLKPNPSQQLEYRQQLQAISDPVAQKNFLNLVWSDQAPTTLEGQL